MIIDKEIIHKMKIQFEGSIELTENQLDHIESLIGKVIPAQIRKLYKYHSNSVPKINGTRCSCKIHCNDGWIIANFIEKIPSFEELQNDLSDKEFLEDYVRHFGLTDEYVEVEHLFPFAILPNGGIYIALEGKHKGKIYAADNGDFGITFQYNSFDLFWNSVY